MSSVKIEGNASGTGIFTIASPNSNTNRTLTLPDVTGTFNTSGGVNEVPAGSASAPAIYPTGDTNTGVFFPAADTIAFTEGGVESMRIDSSGEIGMGTNDPSVFTTDRLAVVATSAGAGTTPLALINNSSSINTAVYMGFAPNININLARVGAIRTDVGGGGATDLALETYTGASLTEKARIDAAGNVGVNNTNPDQYATSGRVFNITGTANNSGPANLFMPGASAQLGAGFASTEVFAISNVTAAQEITRITGTNANGFRAYIKVIVTGHTSGVGNGINIKEWFWDGGTGGVTQISTYTNGSVPTLSVTNTTNYVLIINLASSNGSNGFNGVMKVEWMIPIDFSASTYTIS